MTNANAEGFKPIQTRLSATQVAKIERAAKIKGLSVSAFLRMAALEMADNTLMAYPEGK